MVYMLTRECLLDVFPLRPVPHYRLSDAIIADCWGSKATVFDEQWETWDQIESWQIAKCDVFFSYAPPNAIAYLTPRFMLYVLDEINEPSKVSDSNSGDAFVWWLQRNKKLDFFEVPFEQSQRHMIELFLQRLETDPHYRITLEVGE